MRTSKLASVVLIAQLATLLQIHSAAAVPADEVRGQYVCGAYDQSAKRGVVPEPDALGRTYPVVTIHGITGSDADWEHEVLGTYLDPSAKPLPSRSLLDMLAGNPSFGPNVKGASGAHVYSFSYSADSLRWIDNAKVGGALAATVDCLYKKHGVPVSIVAHSMGGLVARWVAGTTASDGTPRALELGKVVTLGTPYLGSRLVGVVNEAADLVGVADPALFLLRYLCGMLGTRSGKGECLKIPLVSAANSQAGRNLMYKSAAVTALSRWPSGPEVTTVAGSIRLPWNLFGAVLNAPVDVGDVAVSTDSATADPSAGLVVECPYDSAATSGATALRTILRIDDPRRRAAMLNLNLLSSPCYHGMLMRNLTVVNGLVAQLNGWIGAQRLKAVAFKRKADVLLPPLSPSSKSAALELIRNVVGRDGEDCELFKVWGAELPVGSIVFEATLTGGEGCPGDSVVTMYVVKGGKVAEEAAVCGDCAEGGPNDRERLDEVRSAYDGRTPVTIDPVPDPVDCGVRRLSGPQYPAGADYRLVVLPSLGCDKGAAVVARYLFDSQREVGSQAEEVDGLGCMMNTPLTDTPGEEVGSCSSDRPIPEIRFFNP